MPNIYPARDFPSRVYGDSFTFTRERDLDAISRDGLSVFEWGTLMRECCPGGYNGFNTGRVEALLARWMADITLHPAREGSVCVYITGPLRALGEIARSLRADRDGPRHVAADEIHDATLPDGTGAVALRVWWD